MSGDYVPSSGQATFPVMGGTLVIRTAYLVVVVDVPARILASCSHDRRGRGPLDAGGGRPRASGAGWDRSSVTVRDVHAGARHHHGRFVDRARDRSRVPIRLPRHRGTPPTATSPPVRTTHGARPVLARPLRGRATIPIGFAIMALTLAVGVPIGALAAYVGGWFDGESDI